MLFRSDGSSATTQTELTQFLTDGAKEILNSLPKSKKMLYGTATSLNGSSTNLTIGGSEIFNVTRDDGTINQPCRKISPELSGRASDSGDMIAATTTDPVYYIQNNILSVIPEPTNSNNAQVQTLAYPAVAYGDSSITRFPDEAEYLVPLYASVKSLQNLLGSRSSNSDITTALTAAKTELNETQDVCDKIDADLVLAKAEVVLAKTEAAEMATQTDNSGNFETACDAMATELNKVDEIISLANEEFDEVANQTGGSKDSPITDAFTQFELVAAQLTLGETDSEGGVNTALTAVKAEIDECINIVDNMHTEVGLINDEVDLAKIEAAELASQTDNSGDIETALDAINTALDKFRADGDDPALFGDETQYTTGTGITRVIAALTAANDVINNNQPSASTDAYGALANEDTELVSSSLQVAQVEISKAKAYLEEFNSTVRALQAEAQGFANEVSARVSFSGAKSQAIQGYINTANGYATTTRGYGDEVQKKLEIANSYSKEIQSRLQQAQAKREEAKSRISAGSAYLQEAQSTIQAGNAYLQEAQARISQAQGYAAEINARGSFTSAKSKAVQGYISTAQAYVATAKGFGDEIQAKVQIAQGYGSEIQLRLSVDSTQYAWYEKQQAKLQSDYEKGLQAIR